MFQYLCGVIFCLDFLRRDDAFDDAVGRYDECCAECAHIFSSAHRFLGPDTKFLDETVVCVADKRKGQGVLFDKAFVRGRAVDADADDLNVIFD